jgi:hypothetical protein
MIIKNKKEQRKTGRKSIKENIYINLTIYVETPQRGVFLNWRKAYRRKKRSDHYLKPAERQVFLCRYPGVYGTDEPIGGEIGTAHYN